MSIIAELLKVPVEKLKWLHRKYFSKSSERSEKQKDQTNVTVRNITPEEILFLINQHTLKVHAVLSLAKRSIMFHR